MGETIQDITYLIQDVIFTLSFIAISFIMRKKKLGNLKFIYIYSLLCTILTIALRIINEDPNESDIKLSDKLIYWSFLPHYILFSIFIYLESKPLSQNKTIKYSYYTWFAMGLPVLIYYYLNSNLWEVAQTYVNLGLITLSVVYYVNLLKNGKIQNLFLSPSFIAITGIFFSVSTSLPFLTITRIFYEKKMITKDTWYYTKAIFDLLYCIMHLSFIKAFLCLPPRKTA